MSVEGRERSIVKFLRCPNCNIAFSSAEGILPKLMPNCPHTICSNCVANINLRYKQARGCPLCKKSWWRPEAYDMANNPIIMSLIDAQAEDGFDAHKLKTELMQNIERNKQAYEEECGMVDALSEEGVLNFFEASELKERAMQKLSESVSSCKRKYLFDGGDEAYIQEFEQMQYDFIGLSKSFQAECDPNIGSMAEDIKAILSEQRDEAIKSSAITSHDVAAAEVAELTHLPDNTELSEPVESCSNTPDERARHTQATSSATCKKVKGAGASGKDNRGRERRSTDGQKKNPARAISVKVELAQSDNGERIVTREEDRRSQQQQKRSSEMKQRSQEKHAVKPDPSLGVYEPPTLRHAAARTGVCPYLDRVVDEMLELSQKMPFSVMKTTSTEVWDRFEERMSDLKMKQTFSSIKSELLWLLQEIKHEYLREPWYARNYEPFMNKCEICNDSPQLQDLLLDFKCHAVNWRLVHQAMRMDSMSAASSEKTEIKNVKVENGNSVSKKGKMANEKVRDSLGRLMSASALDDPAKAAESYKHGFRNISQTSNGRFQARVYLNAKFRYKFNGRKKIYIRDQYKCAATAAKKADQFLLKHFNKKDVLPYLNFPRAAGR
eukprot:754171-Hanusia_phi.AAC.2